MVNSLVEQVTSCEQLIQKRGGRMLPLMDCETCYKKTSDAMYRIQERERGLSRKPSFRIQNFLATVRNRNIRDAVQFCAACSQCSSEFVVQITNVCNLYLGYFP
jgi:hypothetical protein